MSGPPRTATNIRSGMVPELAKDARMHLLFLEDLSNRADIS